MQTQEEAEAAAYSCVLAEHMEAIRVVAPREYEKVIERIRAI